MWTRTKRTGDEQLPLLTTAYCSSQHAITGFTPNKLMLRREVHQPQDVWSGTAELRSGRAEAPEFLYNLTEGLKEAQSTAREHHRVAQERHKRTYTVRAGEHPYSVGDLVYVKDDTKKKGQSPKLQDPWMGPLIVSACPCPVLYEIRGRQRSKVIHHDRLKLYNSDVVPVWVQRLRSQVLQSYQSSAGLPPEVDSLTVPEPPRPEDISKDTTYCEEPLGSCDTGSPSQPGAPGCPLGKEPAARDSSESVVKTSSGRAFHKPARYKK